MATRAELEDALRNADAAGDVEAARRLADFLATMPSEAATPESVGEVNINQPRSTIASTNRQIKSEGPGGLGQTIRALGAYVPGIDYPTAAGNWVQDRLPEALGGTAPGRERTYDEALNDTRADRTRAETAEPLAALVGGVATAPALPFSKGKGVLPLLKRAAQAGGYATATGLGRGEPLSRAGEQGLLATGLSSTIEGALHLPGALRAVGRAARNRAADHAWWAGTPTETQAAGMAESLGGGISAQRPVGEFMRDARLASGQRLLEVGDKPADVAKKIGTYLEEWGAKKGAAVRAAEEAGAVVDPAATLAEVKGLVRELDTPEMRVNYPDVKRELDAWVERFAKEYGPKEPRLIGISQRGSGAQVTPETITYQPLPSRSGQAPQSVSVTRNPIGPGAAQNANEVGLIPPEQTVKVPMRAGQMPGQEETVTPAMMADMEEGVLPSTPEMIASYERTGPGPEIPRLIPGTSRPAPNSGWSPVFEDAAPPRTLTEWERLKTMIQSLVHDTKSGLMRRGEAIDASPALDRLRAIASKVREADEVAARKVLSPEEFQVFMQAKRNFGTAAEVQPAYLKSVRGAEKAPSNAAGYESRRVGRHLPFALAGAGAGASPGLATGNIPLAVAGGLTGLAAGSLAKVATEAHPTMTRAYDALGRALLKAEGPPVNVDPQLAALLAYLRGVTKEE